MSVPKEIENSGFYFNFPKEKSREEAEKLLRAQKQGNKYFIFRSTSKPGYDFTVSWIEPKGAIGHQVYRVSSTGECKSPDFDSSIAPEAQIGNHFLNANKLIAYYSHHYEGVSNKPAEKTEEKVAVTTKQTTFLTKSEDIEKELAANGFAIHLIKAEGNKFNGNEFAVTVRRDFIVDGKVFKKTDATNRDITCKVKFADFREKLKSNFTDLYSYFNKAIKRLIGFDFDNTLTIDFTFERKHREAKENMRFEGQTKHVLQGLKKDEKNILFIASNNDKNKIDEHVVAWYPEEKAMPFKGGVYDRTTFHKTSHDKELCFRLAHDAAFKAGTNIVGSDGYLRLDAPNPILAVAQGVMVDDDNDTLKALEAYGIKGIPVTTNTTQHLADLDEQYNLGLNLPLQIMVVPTVSGRAGQQPPAAKKSLLSAFFGGASTDKPKQRTPAETAALAMKMGRQRVQQPSGMNVRPTAT